MVNEKGKYIGEPKVTIHRRHGTPEEVARNRENFRQVLSKIYTRINGKDIVLLVLVFAVSFLVSWITNLLI